MILCNVSLQFEGACQQVVLDRAKLRTEDELLGALEATEFLIGGQSQHVDSDIFFKISVVVAKIFEVKSDTFGLSPFLNPILFWEDDADASILE